MLIVVKNAKQASDMERFLLTHYTRKEGAKAYHEQKLFFYLASH